MPWKRILTRSLFAFSGNGSGGLSLPMGNSHLWTAELRRGGMWRWPCASWSAGSRSLKNPMLELWKGVDLVDFREGSRGGWANACASWLASTVAGLLEGQRGLVWGWEGPVTKGRTHAPKAVTSAPHLPHSWRPHYNSAFLKRKKKKRFLKHGPFFKALLNLL